MACAIGLFSALPSVGSETIKSYKAQSILKRFMINAIFTKRQFWYSYNNSKEKSTIAYSCGYSEFILDTCEKLFNAKQNYRTNHYYQSIKRSLLHLMRSDEVFLAVHCYGNPYATPEQTRRFKVRLMHVYYEMFPSELWKKSENLDQFLDFIFNFNKNSDYFYDLVYTS